MISVTTAIWIGNGERSRSQTISAETAADTLALYRLLAEVDAQNTVGEALDRIGGECE